jgi:hypothetical protein
MVFFLLSPDVKILLNGRPITHGYHGLRCHVKSEECRPTPMFLSLFFGWKCTESGTGCQ